MKKQGKAMVGGSSVGEDFVVRPNNYMPQVKSFLEKGTSCFMEK